MRNLRRMLLERCVTVRIVIHVECESNFVSRRFLPRARRSSWCCSSELFRCLTCGTKFLPQQRSRRQLARGVLPLQRAQLTFQLPQRKGQVHFWGDKERLNEKHQRNKGEYPAGKQNETQPRPAFPTGIGENKRRNLFRRELGHGTPIIAQRQK